MSKDIIARMEENQWAVTLKEKYADGDLSILSDIGENNTWRLIHQGDELTTDEKYGCGQNVSKAKEEVTAVMSKRGKKKPAELLVLPKSNGKVELFVLKEGKRGAVRVTTFTNGAENPAGPQLGDGERKVIVRFEEGANAFDWDLTGDLRSFTITHADGWKLQRSKELGDTKEEDEENCLNDEFERYLKADKGEKANAHNFTLELYGDQKLYGEDERKAYEEVKKEFMDLESFEANEGGNSVGGSNGASSGASSSASSGASSQASSGGSSGNDSEDDSEDDSSEEDDDEGLSTGVIVVIVVAAFIVLLLIAVAIKVMRTKKRAAQAAAQATLNPAQQFAQRALGIRQK
jgi:hypothetical protein